MSTSAADISRTISDISGNLAGDISTQLLFKIAIVCVVVVFLYRVIRPGSKRSPGKVAPAPGRSLRPAIAMVAGAIAIIFMLRTFGLLAPRYWEDCILEALPGVTDMATARARAAECLQLPRRDSRVWWGSYEACLRENIRGDEGTEAVGHITSACGQKYSRSSQPERTWHCASTHYDETGKNVPEECLKKNQD